VRSVCLSSTTLQFLHVDWCSHLKSFSLDCNALVCLYGYGCTRLKFPAIYSRSLQRLELQKCAALCDKMLALLAMAEDSQLAVFNLTDCRSLRAPCLVCSRLRRLHLYNCLQMVSLVVCCPELQTLNLTHCVSLSALTVGCPVLTTLVCAGCGKLPDSDLLETIQACSILKTIDVQACKLSSTTKTVLATLMQGS